MAVPGMPVPCCPAIIGAKERTMSDEQLQRGKDIRAEVLGKQRSEAALVTATDFDRPF
jgi:hypothetical protein